MSLSIKLRKQAVIMALALLCALTWTSPSAGAAAWQKKEKQNILIVGDRVMDIAWNLGVYPAAMGVRCSIWPLCGQIKNLVQPLGCPECLAGAKKGKLVGFIKKSGIKSALIEKSQPFCLLKPEVNPLDSARILRELGVEVKLVDFSGGLPSAIRRTAALLGREKAGEELVGAYLKAEEKLKAQLAGVKLGKRVVVLNGVYQSATGKSFLRVEAPGGYTDRFILEPLGCHNVGQALFPTTQKPSKGHVTIRRLKGLAGAKPDVIVITGDSAAVQKALAAAVSQEPELARVPVYSLPMYIDSSVIERPGIVSKWLWALR